ncbi:MAG: type IV pilus twitching motility protein PilT [Planctomycetes bacterium]|nr:type IV pilus twitching motility protein PilT [Planctomycetota bacterium]MBI3846121.1 type IV pilus twitching motility protein PilT [Planctomycetota bacterium]
MNLDALLRDVVKQCGSDIHFKGGNPPIVRVDGELRRLDMPILSSQDCEDILDEILNDTQKKLFAERKELDLPYLIPGISRFRVNVSRERGHVRVVFRLIPMKIPTIVELQLPKVLEEICKKQYGLVLVTGATGTGKSTTLAAMVDEINRKNASHIVTIEDPIEFIHDDQVGIVTQRQIGVDTESFASALRTVLRQDPDVILVGEMRDAETVEAAIMAAETGHLVMSTMQTGEAVESLHRILDFFPREKQHLVRTQFANSLRAIISQRLVPRKEGVGRVAAVEVLIATKLIREFILEDKEMGKIVKLMEEGKEINGSQTFDQALYDLWEEGIISQRTALEYATSPQDLSLRFRGFKAGKEVRSAAV